MADSKARLHCCGAHHHDTHKPAGVTLILSLVADNRPSAGSLQSTTHKDDQRLSCYGTGENEDAAIVLLTGEDGSWTDRRTRILADTIARGANVTVLVPHFTLVHQGVPPDHQDHALPGTINNRKRGHEGDHGHGHSHGHESASRDNHNGQGEDDVSFPVQGTKESLALLMHHLRHAMHVTYLGLLDLTQHAFPELQWHGNNYLNSRQHLHGTDNEKWRIENVIQCLVSIRPLASLSDQSINVTPITTSIPTSHIALTTTTPCEDADDDEETEIIEEPVLVRRTTVRVNHPDPLRVLLEGEESLGYARIMRESLYFFKKHLHDWS